MAQPDYVDKLVWKTGLLQLPTEYIQALGTGDGARVGRIVYPMCFTAPKILCARKEITSAASHVENPTASSVRQ